MIVAAYVLAVLAALVGLFVVGTVSRHVRNVAGRQAAPERPWRPAMLTPADRVGPPSLLLPDSMFDRPVSSWTVAPGSATLAASIVKQYRSAYGSVTVNTDRPVYWASPAQPRVAMHVASGCQDFLVQTGDLVPIPAGAEPGHTSDGILTVYQPSTHSAWEFWRAQDTGGSWSACWGGKLDTRTTNGVFPFPYGETASGISNLATEITENDIASGAIRHAVGMVVLGDSCDWSGTSVHGGLYPANRSDCGYKTPGWPVEGQWFRFPPGLAMPRGLTPFAQMVFKAIQTYGAVVVDQAAAVAVLADQPSAWTAAGNRGIDPITASFEGVPAYKVIAGLPWGKLQALEPPATLVDGVRSGTSG